MCKRTRLAILASMIGLFLPLLQVAPATANDAYIRFFTYKPVCANDGVTVEIGANAYQKEIGKHGVRQFRVTWLVYRTNVGAGFNPSYVRKTKESYRFPNNAVSHRWDGVTGGPGGGSFHRFKNLPATNSYKLVAKLTWDRAGGRKDWNRKVLAAYCG